MQPKKELKEKVNLLRKENKSIVTLNGSFDVLHAGHLHIIYEASKQANVLIIAINSDNSIKKLKGNDRPMIPLKYRLQMLAAIFFVDFVTYFEEINPKEILSIIKPSVHVNGSEYGEDCIEKDIVMKNRGRIYLVDKILSDKNDLSTTSIIKKIKTCV